MALVKAALQTQLDQLFDALATNADGDAARRQFAAGLATAIDAYIKTATVTVTVATAGSATAQTGAGTGTLS